MFTSIFTISASAETASKSFVKLNGIWNAGQSTSYSNATGFSFPGYNSSYIMRTINVTGQTTCSSTPATLYVNLYWNDGVDFYIVDSKTIAASGSVNANFNVAQYGVPVDQGSWWFEIEGYRYNTTSVGAFTLSNGRAEFNFY